MKKKLLSLLFLAIPMLTFAQEKGLDQQIDEAFGDATGWFVNLFFIKFHLQIQLEFIGYYFHLF